ACACRPAGIACTSSGRPSAALTTPSRSPPSTPPTTPCASATTSARAASSPMRTSTLAVVLGVLLAAGCSVVEQKSEDTKRGLAARVGHPVRYRVAGADPVLRVNLDRALDELAAGNHRVALP